MADLLFHLRTLTHVQQEMIRLIGDDTKLLAEIMIGSRSDTVRILKSLFYLVDRIPNQSLTLFRYRPNERGLAAMALLQFQELQDGESGSEVMGERERRRLGRLGGRPRF